jgi:hypothetical protein
VLGRAQRAEADQPLAAGVGVRRSEGVRPRQWAAPVTWLGWRCSPRQALHCDLCCIGRLLPVAVVLGMAGNPCARDPSRAASPSLLLKAVQGRSLAAPGDLGQGACSLQPCTRVLVACSHAHCTDQCGLSLHPAARCAHPCVAATPVLPGAIAGVHPRVRSCHTQQHHVCHRTAATAASRPYPPAVDVRQPSQPCWYTGCTGA